MSKIKTLSLEIESQSNIDIGLMISLNINKLVKFFLYFYFGPLFMKCFFFLYLSSKKVLFSFQIFGWFIYLYLKTLVVLEFQYIFLQFSFSIIPLNVYE